MSIPETETPERAKLDFSFDENHLQEKEEISRKVEQISEQAGFSSRTKPKPHTPPENREPIKLDRRTRTKTGRTYPFNTKIKPETYEKIVSLSDKMTEEQGRYVSLAEIIEKAVEALENK